MFGDRLKKQLKLLACKEFVQDNDVADLFDGVFSKRNIHNISELWTFVVTAAVLLIFSITNYHVRDNMPKALSSSDLLHTENTFIAERAWKDLKILTSFGARPTGSYSNEVLTVDFLKREIGHIKQAAHKSQRLELDVQVVSGAFFRESPKMPMLSVYRKVQNVVVKLHGNGEQSNSNNSLLVNCHFDSVSGSPGASDDAASCVVMLELLRVMSRSKERNEHAIVFLFNGAEETGLQASHGFITQHKWAKDIRAFINLESVGSGGKEMLFQGTPRSSCLIQSYGQSVVHPSAQVAAEEIFQSGLIPSDTDCRIFHDYGNISGLDFAHYLNGHLYHTKYDHIKFLTKESLQHTGSNMLELIRNLANSNCLVDIQESQVDLQVYFDVFGLLFVYYSVKGAQVINYLVAFAGVFCPYLILLRTTKGVSAKYLYSEIFLGLIVKVISALFIGLTVHILAIDLDTNADKSMTWYAHPYICLPTYCLATVLIQCLFEQKFMRTGHTPLSLALRIQARLIGVNLFWSVALAILTYFGIRTAYFLMVPLAVMLVCYMLIGLLNYENTRRKWLYVHLVGEVFIVAWTTNFYHSILEVFTATAGRSGATRNPEIIVGIICGFFTFFSTSFLTSLICLCKNSKHFLITLVMIYGITRYYFIASTHYGFPYEEETAGVIPKVQRHLITHTMRTLFDKEGNIRYTDSGYWMFEFDRNSLKTIDSLAMPEKPVPHDKNILCKSEVLCGLPLYSSRQLMLSGFWIPGPTPNVREKAHLSLVGQEKLGANRQRMNFILTGSYQLSLQILPKDGVVLENWSLMNFVPPSMVYNNQTFQFIMITHGLEEELLNFTLDFHLTGDHMKRSIVDITVTTLHLDYHKDHTSEFSKLLSRLPTWAYAEPMVADLRSWTF